MLIYLLFRHDRSPYRSSRRRRSRSRSSSHHRHYRHRRRDRSRTRSRTPSRSSRQHRSSVFHSSSTNSLGSLLGTSSQKDAGLSRSERVSSVALEALSKIKAGQGKGVGGSSALEGALVIDGTLDKDAEQKRLEMEMIKVSEMTSVVQFMHFTGLNLIAFIFIATRTC